MTTQVHANMSLNPLSKEDFLPYIKTLQAEALTEAKKGLYPEGESYLQSSEGQKRRTYHFHLWDPSSPWNFFSSDRRSYSIFTINPKESVKVSSYSPKETEEEKKKKKEEERAYKDTLLGVILSVVGAVTVGYFGKRFIEYQKAINLSSQALDTVEGINGPLTHENEVTELKKKCTQFIQTQHQINSDNYREAFVDVLSAAFTLLGAVALFCNSQGPNLSVVSAASRMLVLLSGIAFLINKAFNWNNASEHAKLQQKRLEGESQEEGQPRYLGDKIYRWVETYLDEDMGWIIKEEYSPPPLNPLFALNPSAPEL